MGKKKCFFPGEKEKKEKLLIRAMTMNNGQFKAMIVMFVLTFPGIEIFLINLAMPYKTLFQLVV